MNNMASYNANNQSMGSNIFYKFKKNNFPYEIIHHKNVCNRKKEYVFETFTGKDFIDPTLTRKVNKKSNTFVNLTNKNYQEKDNINENLFKKTDGVFNTNHPNEINYRVNEKLSCPSTIPHPDNNFLCAPNSLQNNQSNSTPAPVLPDFSAILPLFNHPESTFYATLNRKESTSGLPLPSISEFLTSTNHLGSTSYSGFI